MGIGSSQGLLYLYWTALACTRYTSADPEEFPFRTRTHCVFGKNLVVVFFSGKRRSHFQSNNSSFVFCFKATSVFRSQNNNRCFAVFVYIYLHTITVSSWPINMIQKRRKANVWDILPIAITCQEKWNTAIPEVIHQWPRSTLPSGSINTLFFKLLWPCIMNVGWRERSQKDATNLMFIIKLLSQHVSGIIMPIIRRTRVCNSNLQSAHSLRPSFTQPQPSLPVQNTICGSAHSCSPDDVHNDARNMLR